MRTISTERPVEHGGFSPLARLTVLAGFIVATLALVMPTAAYAHDGTSEALILTVDQGRVVGTGLVEFADLGLEDTSGDGLIDANELSDQEATVAGTLVGTVRDNITLTINGEALEIIGAGLSFQGATADAELEASEYVGVAFATAEFEGELDELAVTWTFPSPSNAILLSDADGAVLGHLSDDGAVTFTLGTWATASSFLLQGFEHIQFGPDHLLFLIVLALGIVGVKKGRAVWWPAVKLVIAFTLGHAISLCLAYFSIVSIPAAIVEPLIALSIVVAAVLALRRKAAEYRWWIAAVVGLVHGLGFASSLSSLGLVTSDHVIALICFNLGIDIAQTAVVLLVLAVALLLMRLVPKRFEIIRVIVSIAIGLMGLYWAITRVWPF